MKTLQQSVDQRELEHDVLAFWKEKEIFEKLVKKNENSGKRFRFLDGPITANYRMGVHHCWGRTIKDIAHRYKAMQGYSAQYQNGFDAQGMWVEVNVEKELGLSSKPDIEKYGMANFTEKCIERVKFFAGEQTKQSIRMGQWMDWGNSYYTNSDENILSIWHFLKTCASKNLIEIRNRPMAWCPRCGTSLSEHEMSGSYKDVVHTAIFFKLPIENTHDKILVWTTTPWTLAANVAIAINPKNTYVRAKVKSDSKFLILGKEAVKVLKDDLVEIVDEFLGEDLVGKAYETCFPNLKLQNFVHKIVPWEDVDAKEGSGAVHIAPGCGAEDFELGKKHGLPEICPINDMGEMLEDYDFLSGRKTTEVVEDVVEKLKNQNKLFLAHKYKHSYPHCWRCKTDLVYKLIKTWYIKTNDIRACLLKAIEPVKFQPEYARKRMQDWLLNMGDWNISRARYYGLPLPFYVCEKCGNVHVVGSLEELKKLAINKDAVDKIPHLHRPYIDEVKIACPKCKAAVSRIPEVGDCWLDAGITPFSTKKYFTDKKYFKENYSSEFVCEMIEQIKLWFYSLLVMGVVLEGKAPYEMISTYQYVMDENGGEFHKSAGNSLDAEVVADRLGADFMRYLYGGATITNDMRFGDPLCEEAKRKFLGFYNAVLFFNTYASLDKPNLSGYKLDGKKLSPSDLYILSRVNGFASASAAAYDEYKSFIVVREFEKLTDDLTNWYIRTNRKRFWKSEDKDEQMAAYCVLFDVLKKVVQVMAPIMPFSMEYIWQNVMRVYDKTSEESVHLSNFPKFDNKQFDAKLEENTAVVRSIIEMGQMLRNVSQIKVKQPLRVMHVSSEVKDAAAAQIGTILEELNIKECEFADDAKRFNDARLLLNFKVAGSALKGDVQKAKAALEALPEKEMTKLVADFEADRKLSFGGFSGLDCGLFLINYTPKKGYLVETQNNITVAIDITIDEILMFEGLSRELIRTLQVLRKEAGFEIADRIEVCFKTESDALKTTIAKFEEKIKQEVLIKKIAESLSGAFTKIVEVGGDEIEVFLKR